MSQVCKWGLFLLSLFVVIPQAKGEVVDFGEIFAYEPPPYSRTFHSSPCADGEYVIGIRIHAVHIVSSLGDREEVRILKIYCSNEREQGQPRIDESDGRIDGFPYSVSPYFEYDLLCPHPYVVTGIQGITTPPEGIERLEASFYALRLFCKPTNESDKVVATEAGGFSFYQVAQGDYDLDWWQGREYYGRTDAIVSQERYCPEDYALYSLFYYDGDAFYGLGGGYCRTVSEEETQRTYHVYRMEESSDSPSRWYADWNNFDPSRTVSDVNRDMVWVADDSTDDSTDCPEGEHRNIYNRCISDDLVGPVVFGEGDEGENDDDSLTLPLGDLPSNTSPTRIEGNRGGGGCTLIPYKGFENLPNLFFLIVLYGLGMLRRRF